MGLLGSNVEPIYIYGACGLRLATPNEVFGVASLGSYATPVPEHRLAQRIPSSATKNLGELPTEFQNRRAKL